MAKTAPNLNLDKLFSNKQQSITVRWQGRDYELKHPTAMNQQDFVTLSRMQRQVEAMTPDADTPDAGDQLQAAIDKVIAVIAPDLAVAGLPFLAKIRIMSFYSEQVKPAAEGGSAASG